MGGNGPRFEIETTVVSCGSVGVLCSITRSPVLDLPVRSHGFAVADQGSRGDWQPQGLRSVEFAPGGEAEQPQDYSTN